MFGSNLDLCKQTILQAPINLSITVKRQVLGNVGVLLGDWNVAMGNASLFITAHQTATSQASNQTSSSLRGLLFVVMDVSAGWRCSLFVSPADVYSITSQHFGASLLAPAKV